LEAEFARRQIPIELIEAAEEDARQQAAAAGVAAPVFRPPQIPDTRGPNNYPTFDPSRPFGDGVTVTPYTGPAPTGSSGVTEVPITRGPEVLPRVLTYTAPPPPPQQEVTIARPREVLPQYHHVTAAPAPPPPPPRRASTIPLTAPPRRAAPAPPPRRAAVKGRKGGSMATKAKELALIMALHGF
jgi:hypothetical protein